MPDIRIGIKGTVTHMVNKSNQPRSSFKGLFQVFGKQPEPTPPPVRKPRTDVQTHAGITWTDVQDPTHTDLLEIGKKHDLHEAHLNSAFHRGQIAQMELEDNYIFLLLHFPFVLTEKNKIATSNVPVFLGKDYLITLHDGHAQIVRDLFEEYRGKQSPETKSPARILFHLIGKMLRDVERLIQDISVELDEIEDNVFDNEESDALNISQLRQKIMRLRRTLATQKNVLNELDDTIDTFTNEHLARYYQANTNLSVKLWETVEEARETVEIYKDADFTNSQERTNEILGVLTIIFTLAIPATVIGTFMGMNVLLPGGIETGPWTFFGKYTTLLLILTASILPAILMSVWFKKKKWF